VIKGVKQRCGWGTNDPEMLRYHDEEWGAPVHDDRRLFEMLVLEGAQAGLSWSTILHRREHYRRAFDGFDPARVAAYKEKDVDRLLGEPGVIRNRRKIESAVNNARKLLEVQGEFGSFDAYIWGFIGGAPKMNRFTSFREMPAETEESRAMSADLKRRGFSFVGPTICYAYMQSVGMVNDHLVACYRHRELGG
jgi:DNA-3-methyladenine glycosylase I